MHRTVSAAAALVLLAGCADTERVPLAPVDPSFSTNGPPVAPGTILPGSITFISNRSGRVELWVMNPGGENMRQLTFSDQDEARENLEIEWIQNRPVWSPDGRKLLFTRRARNLNVSPAAIIHDVHVLDLDEPDPRPRRLVNSPLAAGAAAWSPDGSRVAYCSGPGNRVWIYDIAADTRTMMAPPSACWPHWSLDGTRIAFHTVGAGATIGIIHVASNTFDFITSHPSDDLASDFHPRWSPDGKSIVFQSSRGKDETGARYWGVFVMASDGSGMRNLTPIPAGHTVAMTWANEVPAWSNNGRHIYFASRRPGSPSTQIHRTTLQGTDVVRMTSPPADRPTAGSTQPDVRPVVRP